jgi:hypothetical protein
VVRFLRRSEGPVVILFGKDAGADAGHVGGTIDYVFSQSQERMYVFASDQLQQDTTYSTF